MIQQLFDLLLQIPQTLANLGNWLVSPLNEKYLNISPLALLGVGGTTFLIALITIHIVKLGNN